MRYAIFDIDGTIADNTHRQHYLKENWAAFFAEMKHDLPIHSIITLIQIIHRDRSTLRARVVLVSGRPECYRQVTEHWLSKYQIPYHQLLMRKDNDQRQDWMVKEDILTTLIKQSGEPPIFVIDDRQQVVDMWRRHGLTCLQPRVAPQEF